MRHRHFCVPYLAVDRTGKTMVITILLKCVLSATFPPLTYLTSFFPLLLFSTSNSNHHSPPLLAESNSLSFFVCKGPLLSSLRGALIRSATLNKEGKTEGERESGGGKERVIWKDRAAAETFGCQSIRREGLRGGRDSGAFDLCLSKGEQQEGPSQTICLSLLAPVPL